MFNKKIFIGLGSFVCSGALLFGVTVAEAAVNLVANPSFEDSTIDDTKPLNWNKGRWGSNTAVFEYSDSGRTGEKSSKVTVSNYSNGDAKWYSDEISVTPDVEYVYTDYFKSTSPHFVTIRFQKNDGTFIYKDIAKLYPSTDWNKVERRFVVPPQVVSLSIFHLIKENGVLETDDHMLKEYVVKEPANESGNLVQNFSVEYESENKLPVNWSKGKWGNNDVVFQYPVGGKSSHNATKVTLKSRSSGDAKWYFEDVPAIGGKTYSYSDVYIATVPTVITARFMLDNGSYIYKDIATLPASAEWKRIPVQFTAPSNAVSMTIFHLINQVGSLITDNTILTPVM